MKAITKTFEQMLKVNIQPFLEQHGFTRKDHDFEKEANQCIQNVRFGFHGVTDETGYFLFSVGVFYPQIEKILDLGVEDPDVHTTIGIIVSQLGPPFRYKEWPIAVWEDMAEIGAQVRRDIEQYGLPYIEKLNTLPKLVEQFEIGQGHPISPGEKIRVLAAAYYLLGKHQKALELLEAAISRFAGKPKQIVFRQLRDYLLTEPKV